MLTFARERCKRFTSSIKFIECSAQELNIANDSIDFVVCQQGLQFFSDKLCAVQEIFRVLCSGGQTVVTTWCPVLECQFFGAICSVLEEIGEPELADMMRIPFDIMPVSELHAKFESAGFENITVLQQERDLVIDGGISHAIKVVYSTPIGPKLKDLSKRQQNLFQLKLTALLEELSPDGTRMGRMVSNVLSATKPISQ